MSFNDTDKLTFVIPSTYINLKVTSLSLLPLRFPFAVFAERAELIHEGVTINLRRLTL